MPYVVVDVRHESVAAGVAFGPSGGGVRFSLCSLCEDDFGVGTCEARLWFAFLEDIAGFALIRGRDGCRVGSSSADKSGLDLQQPITRRDVYNVNGQERPRRKATVIVGRESRG